MYIICASNSGFEDQLTTDKVYQVLQVKGARYSIVNDKGHQLWYGQSHFKVEFF
jgi:hypothetical protein